jgi:von Willebrand factor type A domain
VIKSELESLITRIEYIKKGDKEKLIEFQDCDNELLLMSRSITNIYLLVKFRKPQGGQYLDLLFESAHQYTFFKEVHNWEAVIICLYRISKLQYLNYQNQEAIESIQKSIIYAQQLRIKTVKLKKLMLQILISMYYTDQKDTWADCLSIVKTIKDTNQYTNLVFALVYAKNQKRAKALYYFAKASGDKHPELYRFAKGFLAQIDGHLKIAAGLYLEALGLKKYIDPFIKTMCTYELNGIFNKDIINSIDTSNTIKEVVVLLEFSDLISENLNSMCRNQVCKFLDRMKYNDRFCFCWFNDEVHVLCELIDVSNRNTIKNSIVNQYLYQGKVRLIDAIGQGVVRFNKRPLEKFAGIFCDRGFSNESHKLMVLVCSGQDHSKKYNVSDIAKLLKSNRIGLIIVLYRCLDTEKFDSLTSLSQTKCFYCETVQDIINSFRKIKNLF